VYYGSNVCLNLNRASSVFCLLCNCCFVYICIVSSSTMFAWWKKILKTRTVLQSSQRRPQCMHKPAAKNTIRNHSADPFADPPTWILVGVFRSPICSTQRFDAVCKVDILGPDFQNRCGRNDVYTTCWLSLPWSHHAVFNCMIRLLPEDTSTNYSCDIKSLVCSVSEI